MRELVRSLLIADLPERISPEFLPLPPEIPEERWFGSGAILDTPARPFAEIRFGGRFPGIASVRRRRLEVWIHDDEGDYSRIERWIKHVRDRLDGVQHVVDDAGNEIIMCSWVNDSTDLYDPGYRTNCMSSTFELVGREA